MTRRCRFNAVAACGHGMASAPGALAQAARELQLPEVPVQSDREVGGYGAPTATTATKIEAPLRNIRQTVNVGAPPTETREFRHRSGCTGAKSIK